MKHTLLILFSTIFISFSYSQNMQFSIKGGLNVSSLGNKNIFENYSSKAGVHIGGIVEFPLTEQFSLQSELYYSSEGARILYNTDPWGGNSNYDVNLDYIRVPVLGKFYIFDNFSLEGGVNFGLMIGAKHGGLSFESTGYYPQKILNQYKTFDMQIALGSSYKLHSSVFFSMRYNKGVVNISNINANYYSIKRSNVFQISAGYAF